MGSLEDVIKSLTDEKMIALDEFKVKKKTFQRVLDMIEQDKLRRDDETVQEQIQLTELKKVAAKTEKELTNLKGRQERQLKMLISLEKANEELNKRFEVELKTKDANINKVRLESELIETSIYDAETHLKNVSAGNHWTRVFHGRNIDAIDRHADTVSKQEAQSMSLELDQEESDQRIRVQELELQKKREKAELQRDVKKLNEVTNEADEVEAHVKEIQANIKKLEDQFK